jgi:hypothetical protein
MQNIILIKSDRACVQSGGMVDCLIKYEIFQSYQLGNLLGNSCSLVIPLGGWRFDMP